MSAGDTRSRASTRCSLQRGARADSRGVTLDVARGELVALMGPSGSGKTTILRAIAGLERFSAGRIVVDGVDARRRRRRSPAPTLRELRRKVGMVFQFHCLFEHLSAIENVCLAPVHAHGVGAGRRASDAAASCWRRSASSTAPTRCRASCRAARRSASRSRARWRSIRRCC